MPKKRKDTPAAVKVKQSSVQQILAKELKTVLCIALPASTVAALILLWPLLFPVDPERLVEVAWKHQCTCAAGWIKSLRAEGFTVRDYEMDDISMMRRQWRVPDSIRGCHPASYLGYFLDGHISADALHRLAREHPHAIGIQQVDTIKPSGNDTSKIISSQIVQVDSSGAIKPWPSEKHGNAAY